jgi:hypothetical protein
MKSIEENHYKPDLEILDRYVKFSAELLRISLVAISAIGFVILKTFEKDFHVHLSPHDKIWFFITIVLFSVSAGVCLIHRFYASDYMSYHIAALRTDDPAKKKNETEGGRECLKRASFWLICAEFLFGGGVIALGIALLVFLGMH